jgi:hypothetical protein
VTIHIPADVLVLLSWLLLTFGLSELVRRLIVRRQARSVIRRRLGIE